MNAKSNQALCSEVGGRGGVSCLEGHGQNATKKGRDRARHSDAPVNMNEVVAVTTPAVKRQPAAFTKDRRAVSFEMTIASSSVMCTSGVLRTRTFACCPIAMGSAHAGNFGAVVALGSRGDATLVNLKPSAPWQIKTTRSTKLLICWREKKSCTISFEEFVILWVTPSAPKHSSF